MASNTQPLPLARERPTTLHTGTLQEKHQFHLPANTAGKSHVRNVPQLLPKPQQPPSTPFVVANSYGPAPVLSAPVPASTQSYRKRKEQEEKSAVVPTKRYKPRVGASKCSKCHADRTADTGHKQYFGNWFCPNTASETYEEWRSRLAEKKYKKKN